ncbi:sensor histidine kinase [Luteococcus sp. OSA5]|uniref:sensor histidine kinase n=1 Tax=Luteococcus sp. OSA5 TaxID=3401630 RepID=UPI003B4399A9
MGYGLVTITSVLLATNVVFVLLWLRERRALARMARSQARLAELVEQRVERPNVFGHEVRTPLALISGAAELLAEQSPGPLNERQLEFVNTIASNSRQVVAMAEDLLVEAQIEAEIFELRPEQVELRSLVRATVREVRRITATPLVLVDQGPPIQLWADPDLLRQALWNLVNNAVRHAGEPGRVTVEVSASEDEAILQVSDEGQGMGEEERGRLFEPYAVGQSRRPGTGLGMMITRQIVNRHGGRILVDSVPGQGTAILLALPLYAVDEHRAGGS